MEPTAVQALDVLVQVAAATKLTAAEHDALRKCAEIVLKALQPDTVKPPEEPAA